MNATPFAWRIAAILAVGSNIAFVSNAGAATEQAIAACVAEAQKPHGALYIRGLSQRDVRRHQDRMSGLCEAWRTVSDDTRADLLTRCEDEADRMVHTYRGWLRLGKHVRILRGHCRALNAMSNG
jgi:hypothetical protein